MKYLFSVYDSAAKFFRDPFVSSSRGEALSQFMAGCNTKDSWLCERPDHFTLFMLGSFDEQDGKFELLATPESLGLAVEFIKPKQELLKD